MSELWNNCLERLEGILSENDFNTWVRPLQADLVGTKLTVYAPNQFVRDWLQENLAKELLDSVQHFKGIDFSVDVLIGSNDTELNDIAAPCDLGSAIPTETVSAALNPAFTFETHIEGKSNQIARAATQQVGENPGDSYNPLFLSLIHISGPRDRG